MPLIKSVRSSNKIIDVLTHHHKDGGREGRKRAATGVTRGAATNTAADAATGAALDTVKGAAVDAAANTVACAGDEYGNGYGGRRGDKVGGAEVCG